MTKSGKFEIKKKFVYKSERVKALDLHPDEPWALSALYNGQLHILNYETQSVVKSFDVASTPIRAAKFIVRKNWIICGSDDLSIRIFNYNTQERVAQFQAHNDYIRCLAVHPSKSIIVSGGDDLIIKIWDWEKNWSCVKTFEGFHSHYIMALAFNPKDSNTFASASLDRTIKVWNLSTNVPNYTLEGHEKGVCAIDYFPGSDKPYLASGGDDKQVKIWDYQNKSCLQTLVGHMNNISCVKFHPLLPILFTGSEDDTARVWNATTWKQEKSVSFGMERVWAIATQKGSNLVAFGTDKGTVVAGVGKDEPVVCMEANSGKIISVKGGSQVYQSQIKPEIDVRDGERLSLPNKELGHCDILPVRLLPSPSGRLVTVLGDSEFVIYTSLAWRNKSFGTGIDFCWSADSVFYAVLSLNNKVEIYKNFELTKTLNSYTSEVFGNGPLLATVTNDMLCFLTWDEGLLIRRMDVTPKAIYWSSSGDYCAIVTDRDGSFILRYESSEVKSFLDSGMPIPPDGIDASFAVTGEISSDNEATSACWVGDCFVFTTALNQLVYFLGDSTYTIANMGKALGHLYLLDYHHKSGRLYLADRDFSIYSFHLSLYMIQFQILVLQGDLSTAMSEALPYISDEKEKLVLAKFLEKAGHCKEAMSLTPDLAHKFKLAMDLKDISVAHELAEQLKSKACWMSLAQLALSLKDLEMVKRSYKNSGEQSTLLLILALSRDRAALKAMADDASVKGNVRFLAAFMAGDQSKVVDMLCKAKKFPEASLYAKKNKMDASHINYLWKEHLVSKGIPIPPMLGGATDTLPVELESSLKGMSLENSSFEPPASQLRDDVSLPDTGSCTWTDNLPQKSSFASAPVDQVYETLKSPSCSTAPASKINPSVDPFAFAFEEQDSTSFGVEDSFVQSPPLTSSSKPEERNASVIESMNEFIVAHQHPTDSEKVDSDLEAFLSPKMASTSHEISKASTEGIFSEPQSPPNHATATTDVAFTAPFSSYGQQQQEDDDISSAWNDNVSMEVNTTGTGSVRGYDDWDDFSVGAGVIRAFPEQSLNDGCVPEKDAFADDFDESQEWAHDFSVSKNIPEVNQFEDEQLQEEEEMQVEESEPPMLQPKLALPKLSTTGFVNTKKAPPTLPSFTQKFMSMKVSSAASTTSEPSSSSSRPAQESGFAIQSTNFSSSSVDGHSTFSREQSQPSTPFKLSRGTADVPFVVKKKDASSKED